MLSARQALTQDLPVREGQTMLCRQTHFRTLSVQDCEIDLASWVAKGGACFVCAKLHCVAGGEKGDWQVGGSRWTKLNTESETLIELGRLTAEISTPDMKPPS